MSILHLHLQHVYFDQIAAGTKSQEYRLSSKWAPRLDGKTFTEIHLYRGYPRRGRAGSVLRRQWRGFTRETITHPYFGAQPVEVLAIDVTGVVNAAGEPPATKTQQ